jgi:hypothetical protein
MCQATTWTRPLLRVFGCFLIGLTSSAALCQCAGRGGGQSSGSISPGLTAAYAAGPAANYSGSGLNSGYPGFNPLNVYGSQQQIRVQAAMQLQSLQNSVYQQVAYNQQQSELRAQKRAGARELQEQKKAEREQEVTEIRQRNLSRGSGASRLATNKPSAVSLTRAVQP